MSDTIERIEPTSTIDGIDATAGNDIGRSEKPSSGSPQPERPVENLSGFDVYSPADATSTAGTTPRRRGRPPGSRNRNAGGEPTDIGSAREGRAKTPGDITDLTKVLLSMHDMLAAVCKAEYVEITAEQAKKLSAGIKEVGKHYSFNMTAKQVAIADLVMIVLAIYGPMFVILFKGITKPKVKDNLRTMPSPAPVQTQSPNPSTVAQAAPVAQPAPAPKKGPTNPSEIWQSASELDITAI